MSDETPNPFDITQTPINYDPLLTPQKLEELDHRISTMDPAAAAALAERIGVLTKQNKSGNEILQSIVGVLKTGIGLAICLFLCIGLSSVQAAQDTDANKVTVNRDNGTVKANFTFDVRDILNKKLESKKETREVLKVIEKELKRLRDENEKRKDDRETKPAPKSEAVIPENSVNAGKDYRVVKTFWVGKPTTC